MTPDGATRKALEAARDELLERGWSLNSAFYDCYFCAADTRAKQPHRSDCSWRQAMDRIDEALRET